MACETRLPEASDFIWQSLLFPHNSTFRGLFVPQFQYPILPDVFFRPPRGLEASSAPCALRVIIKCGAGGGKTAAAGRRPVSAIRLGARLAPCTGGGRSSLERLPDPALSCWKAGSRHHTILHYTTLYYTILYYTTAGLLLLTRKLIGTTGNR